MQRVDIPFRVALEDGASHEGHIRLGDMAKAERQHGLAAGELATRPPLYFLLTCTYHALARTGAVTSDHDAFCDQIVSFDFGADSGEAPAPSGDAA